MNNKLDDKVNELKKEIEAMNSTFDREKFDGIEFKLIDDDYVIENKQS